MTEWTSVAVILREAIATKDLARSSAYAAFIGGRRSEILRFALNDMNRVRR
jgi:hypothetical protein